MQLRVYRRILIGSNAICSHSFPCLLVEGLGVGGGGGDVSVTGSLVGASGELEGMGSLEVSVARALVRGRVVFGKVEVFSKAGKHGGLWVDHCCDLKLLVFKNAVGWDKQQAELAR